MRTKITLAFAFALSILFHLSCKKPEIITGRNNDQEITERFLKVPVSSPSQITRVIDQLKQLQQSNKYITSTLLGNGFPLWEKSIISSKSKKTKSRTSRHSGTDTIVIVPMALDNKNYVNAVIVAKLTDSVNISFYRASDYTKYRFGNLDDSSSSAEKLAAQFMVLDKIIFDHSFFKVNDNRLFKSPHDSLLGSTQPRIVHIEEANHSTNNRDLEEYEVDYRLCYTSTYLECSANTTCCGRSGVAAGTCDQCVSHNCLKTRFQCTVSTISITAEQDWYPAVEQLAPTGTLTGSGGWTAGLSVITTNIANLLSQSITAHQVLFLESYPARAVEINNFLFNNNYSELTLDDRKALVKVHLSELISNQDYLQMNESYSSSAALMHPWMVDLFTELASEIGLKVIKKYLPGYGDWQSIKDALSNASHGDWLGALGEVINIVKKRVPLLAAIDATIDVFNFGSLANKAWKAFDKIREMPTSVFNGLVKTIKEKCGGILGNLLHDDTGGGYSQAFIKFNTNNPYSFFQSLASNLGKTITTHPNGGYFDAGTIRFNFYWDATSVPHLPTIELKFQNGKNYKLRITN